MNFNELATPEVVNSLKLGLGGEDGAQSLDLD